MPSPSIVGSPVTSKKTAYDTSPFAVTLPAAEAEEAILVVVAYSVGNARNFPTPSGWSQKAALVGNSNSFESYIYAREAAGGDTLTLDNSAGSASGVAIAYRVQGWSGNIAEIVATLVNRGGDIGNPPALTAPWGSADNLWFAGIIVSNVIPVSTYPAGYSLGQAQVAEPGVTNRLAMAARQLTAETEDPSPFGPGLTDGFSQTFTIAVRGTASSAATAVTLSGPSSGTVGSPSTNFTVGADGDITGTVTVTPNDGGDGGSFSPTSVEISAGTPTATFTYTAANAGAPTATIAVTNDGGLANPAGIDYTATLPAATTLAVSVPDAAGVTGVNGVVLSAAAPGAGVSVIATVAGASFNGSGLLNIDIAGLGVTVGARRWVDLTTSNGDPAQSPPPFVAAGPVVAS